MSMGEICIREVVIARGTESINKAAQLMRDYSVGNVIIMENAHPIGILTDRDITIRVVAEGKDPGKTLIKDVMTAQVTTISESAGIGDGIRIMHGKGIRRLPVIDQEEKLVGIATLDDLIDLLAEEMSALAGLIRYEQEKERKE
ncbi:MAG: CBS domain-containing protein [Desulfobacterales bacterium]|nr:CBS domain-containing protein [Desulfobacterales bacterium]